VCDGFVYKDQRNNLITVFPQLATFSISELFFFELKTTIEVVFTTTTFSFEDIVGIFFSPTTVQCKMYLISKVSIAVLSIEVTSCLLLSRDGTL